jgi:hypothetical protein
MASKNLSSKKQKQEADLHQRQMRRNQIIMAVFSLFLILSMVLGLLINLR